jgi:ABC-type nitrate/sulfonate/bicarbonate transport system ATPase subunit
VTAESPLVVLENVGFSYPAVVAKDTGFSLADISIAFSRGKIVALLGRSGSGKTTIAHLAAGLLQPTSGRVVRSGNPPPGSAYVFQSPRLIPWLSVSENAFFATGDVQKTEADARLAQILPLLRLESAGSRLPHELSGGMKQRSAFARALISEHPLLILDEPFGGTDFVLKEALYQMVLRSAEEQRAVILVTHDIREAARLADEIVVLGGGIVSGISERIAVETVPVQKRLPENELFQKYASGLELRIRRSFQIGQGAGLQPL